EEMGRVACPAPVSEQIAAGLYLGRAVPNDPDLQSIVGGQRVVTVAVEEAPGAATRVRDGRLEGEKIIVPYGIAADTIIVVARDGGGTSYVAVDPSGAGVTRTPLQTLSNDQDARLIFNGATGRHLGGATPGSNRDFLTIYRLCRDAFCIGLMSRMLDIS